MKPMCMDCVHFEASIFASCVGYGGCAPVGRQRSRLCNDKPCEHFEPWPCSEHRKAWMLKRFVPEGLGASDDVR